MLFIILKKIRNGVGDIAQWYFITIYKVLGSILSTARKKK
jgi:hypothetical protein